MAEDYPIKILDVESNPSGTIQTWIEGNVTKLEKCCAHIKDYSSHYDRIVNNGLRQHRLSDIGRGLAYAMLQAIGQTSPLPEQLAVYRGMSNYQDKTGNVMSFDNLQVGDTFVDDAFMSTSIEPAIAVGFFTNESSEKARKELEEEGIVKEIMGNLEEELEELQVRMQQIWEDNPPPVYATSESYESFQQRADEWQKERSRQREIIQQESDIIHEKLVVPRELLDKEVQKRALQFGMVLRMVLPEGFRALPLMGTKLTMIEHEREIIIAPCVRWRVVLKERRQLVTEREGEDSRQIPFNLVTVEPISSCPDRLTRLTSWFDPTIDEKFSRFVSTVYRLIRDPYVDLVLISDEPTPTHTYTFFLGQGSNVYTGFPYMNSDREDIWAFIYVKWQFQPLYIIGVSFLTREYRDVTWGNDYHYKLDVYPATDKYTYTDEESKPYKGAILPLYGFHPDLAKVGGEVLMKEWQLHEPDNTVYDEVDIKGFLKRLEQQPELPVIALLPIYRLIQSKPKEFSKETIRHLSLLLTFKTEYQWFHNYTGAVVRDINVLKQRAFTVTPTAFNAFRTMFDGPTSRYYSSIRDNTVVTIGKGYHKNRYHIQNKDDYHTREPAPIISYDSEDWIAVGQNINGEYFYHPIVNGEEVNRNVLYVPNEGIYTSDDTTPRLYRRDHRYYFLYFDGRLVPIAKPAHMIYFDYVQPLMALKALDNKIYIYNTQTNEPVNVINLYIESRDPIRNINSVMQSFIGIHDGEPIYAGQAYIIFDVGGKKYSLQMKSHTYLSEYLLIDGFLVHHHDVKFIGHLLRYPILNMMTEGYMSDTQARPSDVHMRLTSVDIQPYRP